MERVTELLNPKSAVYEIAMNSLHMRKVCAKLVPKVTQFLADSKIPTIPQPLYSPDLASIDFILFPCLKIPMKGNHFGTVDKINDAWTRTLKNILKEAYRVAFDAWKSM
ncbi:Hypothetical protein CINCED_3A012396 [Cinara cedri]|uniref:Uncharacterized protein n=1 Tax=Cinara cedri TaxID=506608 RepID=A0A5E4MAI1_9HEMI|nr:Hypothetical protein CINCED_3A012396 [Cinara cedri]